MRMLRRSVLLIFMLSNFFLVTAYAQDWKDRSENASYIQRSFKVVSDVMADNNLSPLLTSRMYAYLSITAYEIIVQDNADYRGMSGHLQGLLPIPKPEDDKDLSRTIAAVHAMLTVAKALHVPNNKIDGFEEGLTGEYRAAGIPEYAITKSFTYGQQVADHIMAWIEKQAHKNDQ